MNFYRRRHFTELWSVIGDFKEINCMATMTDEGFTAQSDDIKLISNIKETKGEVYSRTDIVKNLTNTSFFFSALGSKISLDGGEWEVYTQYNGWQNESLGGWSELYSTVSVRCNSVRSSHDASPFLALYNKQNGRGVAFHILTSAAWQIRATRVYSGSGEGSYVEIEAGYLPDGLCYRLMPNEELKLPELIYYEFNNKTDMDAHKLHSYLNERIGKRQLPVVYNTWMYKFDDFTYEDIKGQLPRARELGVEYFVIDAGWFGKTKDWFAGRGDWHENTEIGFRGRMSEFAEEVRSYGMKFGFWLEPECAAENSDIMHDHPEWFLKGKKSYFLDFTNPAAYNYIFNKTSELIEKYSAKYIKFDFNADLEYDKSNSAFIKYAAAHERYIKELRKRFPDLYLECCGSGGARMNIHEATLYDSFWPSDNESPYVGLRIYKDTLLRLSPQYIDCFVALSSINGVTPHYECSENKLLACADAIWDNVASVRHSFLYGYLIGSPIGLSFDLNSLSDEDFSSLKNTIESFKNKREFYREAVCHLLADTKSVTALEYRSEDFSKVEIVLFVKKRLQDNITLYPIVNTSCEYLSGDGESVSGGILAKDGVDIPIDESFSAVIKYFEATER